MQAELAVYSEKRVKDIQHFLEARSTPIMIILGPSGIGK